MVFPLQEKLQKNLPGSVVTLLFGLGLTLTLLHALGLLAHGVMAALLLTGVTAALTLAAMDRRMAIFVGGCGVLAAVICLLMGGVNALGQVALALRMHINGLTTALPFVGAETAVIGAILCALAAFFVTQRGAGPYPALVVVLLTAVLIWLGGEPGALWCLLPSVMASVVLFLRGEHDISPLRVLPLAAVLTLLGFIGVAAGGATILALKETADTLRQKIYDIFFFTGSRDEFSLADVGYYPQGENQLGGPAEPSTDPIMAVITPRTVYLRGVIRNEYTGSYWRDATEAKRYLWNGPRHQSLKATLFDMELPAVTDPAFGDLLAQRKVIVRMVGSSASTLFMPQRVRQIALEGALTPYYNESSELFITRNLQPGDVYEADAAVMAAGERGVAELIALCADAADLNWDAVVQANLSLPDHMQDEVYDIARAAIAGASTPYEKAMAIQQYLQSNYTYTLDAPIQPSNQDFVTTFLLVEKQGYCTHFASAMTVLCRMAGLPARYVEGFVANPDETGMAIITGEQGHAWTEVYFVGFGWLTFDATPAGAEITYVTPDQIVQEPEEPDYPEPSPAPTATPDPTPTASPETEAPTPSPTPSESPEPSHEPDPTAADQPDQTDEPDAHMPPFPWMVLLVLMAVMALFMRILWMTPSMQASRCKREFARWLVWAQAAHDALRMLGFERQSDETPMAFFARVDESRRIPRVLSQLSGAESLMFYGHAEPLPEETAQARKTYDLIRSQLTSWQKLCMTLMRAFAWRRSNDITMR